MRAARQGGRSPAIRSRHHGRGSLRQRAPSRSRERRRRRVAYRHLPQRPRRHREPRREDPPHTRGRLCLTHHITRRGGGEEAMSLTRLLAVARKEVLQILRDTRSLAIVVVMPITLMLLFGYGVNLDLKQLPVFVYDQDGSQQSQDLLKSFQNTRYFHIVRAVDNIPAIEHGLDSGEAKMGIVIPWNFSHRLSQG